MEIPKILWLKRRMSQELFERCQFFDLPDYLTYRATGSTARSCCSLTCKCSYVSVVEPKAGVDGTFYLLSYFHCSSLTSSPHICPGRTPPSGGWDDQFFHTIGLGELVERGYGQIGRATNNSANGVEKTTAGIPVGKGLSKTAAEELGLEEGIAVGSGLIDAYAGWLGTVGARCVVASGEAGVAGTGRQEEIRLEPPPEVEESGRRLAVVAGTSSCHIVQVWASCWSEYLGKADKCAVEQGGYFCEGNMGSV
jgi:ribulose kinase